MNEQELRALVREAIARHVRETTPSLPARGAQAGPTTVRGSAVFQAHPSHGTFAVPAGADSDGPCLIEPAVMCNHCGYCKSLGH
jgi:hypothetical protein